MRTIAFLLLLILPTFSEEKPPETKIEIPSLSDLAKKLLGEKGGDRLFYYPTKTAPNHPGTYNWRFEDVFFKSADGTKLHGWFIKPPKGTAVKGTIVFHHGNAGSVGHHLPFVGWMMRGGYQVLLYDYRGFGKSEGKITRKGIVEDVRAAFDYVRQRKDVKASRLISFGHSLGGAKSLAALGQKAVPGLRAVISYAGFASYQDMASHVAGKTGRELVTDDLSARDLVAKISPVPLLIIHGEKDGTVPLAQADILFKKAQEPKVLWKVKGGGHVRALSQKNGEYRKKVLQWLDQLPVK